MDELRAFSADVYCLQEVSEKGLAETFIPGLLRIGLHCFGALENYMIAHCGRTFGLMLSRTTFFLRHLTRVCSHERP